MYVVGLIDGTTIHRSIVGDGDSDLVPFHMIVVFLSCIYISASLDRTGFFDDMAARSMGTAVIPQDIFWKNCVLCGILSIIVSPDVTVMSVTPFMQHFCQIRRIKPLPFLVLTLFSTSVYGVRSLASASTYAMTEAYGISQWDYFLWFVSPHSVVLILCYWCTKTLFMIRDDFGDVTVTANEEEMLLVEPSTYQQPVGASNEDTKNRFLANSFAIILGITTLMMTFAEGFCAVWVSSFLGAVCIAICYLIRDIQNDGGEEPSMFMSSLKDIKLHWAPFVFFCFVLIESLREQGFVEKIADVLRTRDEIDDEAEVSPFRLAFLVTIYTVGSIVTTGFVNKNPATIGFCRLLLDSKFTVPVRERWAMSLGVMFGLNMGIYLAPMGSMTVFAWMDVLKRKGIHLSFGDFIMLGLKCLTFPLCFGIIVLAWEASFWNPPPIRVTAAPQVRPWSGWMAHKRIMDYTGGDWTRGR